MYVQGLAEALVVMLFIAVLIGMAIMAVLVWLIPWLWELIKPWLHMITA
jgi:hypothetical protein